MYLNPNIFKTTTDGNNVVPQTNRLFTISLAITDFLLDLGVDDVAKPDFADFKTYVSASSRSIRTIIKHMAADANLNGTVTMAYLDLDTLSKIHRDVVETSQSKTMSKEAKIDKLLDYTSSLLPYAKRLYEINSKAQERIEKLNASASKEK